MTADDRRGM